MRCVVQRVNSASVKVDGEVVGKIGKGLCIFVGFARTDTFADIDFCVNRLVNLRIFTDGDGKLNLSVLDEGGEVLIVSNFTLLGDCLHGRRPSYSLSASAEQGRVLYDYMLAEMSKRISTQHGTFQAHMQLDIDANGPVNVVLDYPKI